MVPSPESSAGPGADDAATGLADSAVDLAAVGDFNDAALAFEHLPVPAWIADAQGYIHRYNRAWYAHTGLSAEQLRGWGWQAVQHPDHLPRVMAEWQRALATGEPFDLIFPMRGADGDYRLFQTRAVPLRDAAGRIVRWFGTNSDVTALQAAERAADDNARLLSTIIDHVPAMVYAKDRDYRLTLANNSVLADIGKPANQVIGRTDEDWLDAEGLAAVRRHDHHVLSTGETIEQEEPVIFGDGRARTYLTRKTPLYDAAGSIVGLVGTSMDITERKAQQRALEDREAYLRRVLDQLFAFVGITTLDGVLTFTNAAPLEAGGLAAADVWGRNFWECPWWAHSEEAQIICREGIATAAAGGVYRCDVVVRMADDARMSIDYQAGPLRDEDGTIIALVHSGVNIEDRVRAEQLQLALIGELHHRVKNLFAMVIAMIQLTARQATDVATLTAALTGRIQALARSLDLIRPDPHGPADDRAMGLAGLIERVVEPHGLDRFTITGPALAVASAATAPLALVFHELATNSVKYGALSVPGGAVEIDWTIADDMATCLWRERGGPPIVAPPADAGFGTRLIDLSAVHQLGGSVDRQWQRDGLVVTVRVPLARLTG